MTFELTCYRLDAHAVPIAPARPERAIFDANRHAYRCLPLTTANTAGWELLCPAGVEIGWNGGPELTDLHIAHDDPAQPFAKSNFSRGIVTFDTRWLFRTSPGHHLWAMGPTNDPKDGIAALAGLIETDWLPYTFTMNWQMTRPGRVRFEKGEAFCFLTPGQIAAVADCQPVERRIGDDAELQASLAAWSKERDDFMERFRARDPEALKNPWGRRYFKGEQAPGAPAGPPERHFQKLRARPLATTRTITCAADAAGLDFLVVDDVLPAGMCERLASLHAANPDRFERPAETFWQDRLLGYREIREVDTTAAAVVQEVLAWAACKVRDFYGVAAPLFADTVHLVGWREGQSMPAHADNAHRDGSPHALAHRAYSGVIYLDDSYEGGELYLPRQDIAIKPKRGMFVSLPAGLSHEHAVKRVERGARTTMAFFLTQDPARADRQLLPAEAALSET